MKLENLLDKEYRLINAESYSSLKNILKSPEVFVYYKTKPFKGSAATILGTAVHHALQDNYSLIMFQDTARTKEAKLEAKEKEEAFLKEKPDGLVVPLSIQEKIDIIHKNCKGNEKIQKLLQLCSFEVGFSGKIGHLDLKGKLDGYSKDFILDIKTTSTGVSVKEFKETCYKYDYDMQAAMYLHLSEAPHKNYYFIVCSTIAPFDVMLYKASEELIISGKKKLLLAIERHKRYIVDGEAWETPIEEI